MRVGFSIRVRARARIRVRGTAKFTPQRQLEHQWNERIDGASDGYSFWFELAILTVVVCSCPNTSRNPIPSFADLAERKINLYSIVGSVEEYFSQPNT